MGEHYRTLSAIFPLIIENNMILLHRRENTGYQDGKWDIAGSGHVDEGETAKYAIVRECKEELGIIVKAEDLKFLHLSRRFSSDRIYYDIYFIVNKYNQTPSIMELNKCSELKWFDINNLPTDIIECRRLDINNYLNGILYCEKIEWKSKY